MGYGSSGYASMLQPVRDIILCVFLTETHTYNMQVAGFVSTRTDVQCREKWVNCLDPALKLGPWTQEEDTILCQQVCQIYGMLLFYWIVVVSKHLATFWCKS